MWIKVVVAVLGFFTLMFLIGAGGYQQGFSAGQTDTAEKVFRYCHDQGGFLRNQNTGELVGCGRVAQGPGA